MAGKSTFLRQNVADRDLAQAGSFVPARGRISVSSMRSTAASARGRSPRGRSTFMVEMVETAAILNQAGPALARHPRRIGRGTATFDGLSHRLGASNICTRTNFSRALFATHYHELTALSAKLPRLANATRR